MIIRLEHNILHMGWHHSITQRIIIGGGVGSNLHLLKVVREQTQSFINGYIPSRAILEEIDSYIVLPALGNRAGALGVIALAKEAWEKNKK